MAVTSCVGAAGSGFAAKSTLDTRKISDAVKADAAQLVLDFNAHDAVRAAGHDAPDVIVMEGGAPNVTGAAADLAGFKKGFASDPTSKIACIDEAVDVAASGDMAIYRAIYDHSWTRTNTPVTRKVNFLAVYKPHADGSWKIQWYVLSGMEPAQPLAAPTKN
jgi:ketosteroid isomerase-like protein